MARIMIADDSPSVRRLISILVTQAGHEVVFQANNGLEVLNAYFEANPDLLIVDFQMPIMDGISLIEELAKEDPHAKVIMCTGSIEKLQSDSRMNKDVMVIEKPFDNNDFIQSISTVLAN